jgi:hypothetical protein
VASSPVPVKFRPDLQVPVVICQPHRQVRDVSGFLVAQFSITQSICVHPIRMEHHWEIDEVHRVKLTGIEMREIYSRVAARHVRVDMHVSTTSRCTV